jgi:hypothetical protein
MSSDDRLDELAERDDLLLLSDSNDRTAYLGGGPDHFVSEVHDDSPGPQQKTIERAAAKRMVRGWNVVGFEDVPRADEFEPPAWVGEYETETYRGLMLYPAPGDWELSIVEGDCIRWKRPEMPGPEDQYWESHDSWSPDNEAGTINEFELGGGFNPDETVTTRFSVDGETIFSLTDPSHDELMAPIAEILARVAGDEDLEEIVDDVELPSDAEEPKTAEEIAEENGSTLGDFAGGRDD